MAMALAFRRDPARFTTWLLAWLLGATMAEAQVARYVLNGDWSFRRAGTEAWYPAQVPGEVHSDLLRQGLIPDPWRNFNVDSVQWVEHADWTYRCTFQAGPEIQGKRHVELIFKGLDTFADVYLNDSLLGHADNMFRIWSWPVENLLQPGDNKLTVTFHNAVAQGQRERAAYGPQLPADSDPGGTSPYVRKAAYQFGWDFAPRLVGCGIWQDVELQGWNTARINGLRVEQRPDGTGVRVTIRPAILGSASTLEYWLDDELLAEHQFQEPADGSNPLFEFTVGGDQLWWPNGSGPQRLHRLRLVLKGRDGAVLDSREKRVGFRTVELRQEPDSIGRSFTFLVNGKPLFMQGANVVPPDLLPSRAGDRGWTDLVAAARRAHMNMLRVWAGGIYPPEVFFNACDTAGILVWQDFMLANLVPAEGAFLDNIRQEAREQCERISLHPSAALFCGNNELEVAWNNWGWQAKYGLHGADSARVIQSNRHLWQQVLAAEAERCGMPYTWTSPLSNWGNAAGLRSGDLHYWGVWHGDAPLAAYKDNVGRFVSEYGFQSWPDSALLARYIDPDQLYLGSRALRFRQRSYKTDAPIYQAILERTGRRPTTLGAFIKASQAVQADACTLAIEAQQAARPRCMGTLVWQLNDCWPGPSWSLMDVEGRWKPAMYAVQRLYAP
jgi:beta-mannosidase